MAKSVSTIILYKLINNINICTNTSYVYELTGCVLASFVKV